MLDILNYVSANILSNSLYPISANVLSNVKVYFATVWKLPERPGLQTQFLWILRGPLRMHTVSQEAKKQDR